MTTNTDAAIERLRSAVDEYEAQQHKYGYPSVDVYTLLSVLEAVNSDIKKLTQPHKQGEDRE